MQPPETIEILLEELQSTDPSLRKTAAERLGQRTPAEQRTLDVLTVAAKADDEEAVRSAAAKSYLDLTGAELSQPSSETAAAMTATPKTYPRRNRWIKFALAAILSFTVVVVLLLGAALLSSGNWPPSLEFLLPFNFEYIYKYQIEPVFNIFYATVLVFIIFLVVSVSVRQYAIALGITVGLLCGVAFSWLWALDQCIRTGCFIG